MALIVLSVNSVILSLVEVGLIKKLIVEIKSGGLIFFCNISKAACTSLVINANTSFVVVVEKHS